MSNWRGISYPVMPGERGVFNEEENETLIQGNILQILGTYKGERRMLPTFGTRLRDFIHEPLDAATMQLIKVDVVDAIREWEPRIQLTGAEVAAEDREQGFVRIALKYRLLNSPDEHTMDVRVDKGGGADMWNASISHARTTQR